MLSPDKVVPVLANFKEQDSVKFRFILHSQVNAVLLELLFWKVPQFIKVLFSARMVKDFDSSSINNRGI